MDEPRVIEPFTAAWSSTRMDTATLPSLMPREPPCGASPLERRPTGICSFARIGAVLVSPRSCEGSLTAPSTTASLGTRSVVNAPWSISGFRFVLAGMSWEATTTSLRNSPVTASSLTPFV